MYHGIIFDLDGTLVDSAADLADSLNHVLAHRGFPVHSVDAVRLMVGNGMQVLVQRALPEGSRDEALVASLRGEVAAQYDRRCLDLTRPYPGIIELVEELGSRRMKMAVLSNKPEAFTRRIVEALFRSGSFSIIRGQGDSFPTKPDPASSLDIARNWGIDAKDTIFLGDSEVDIRTGRAAGMKAIGALWGFRSREELVEAGAEALLAGPTDLIQWLDSRP